MSEADGESPAFDGGDRLSGQKSPDAFRTISEVSSELDVPQHVLRFWEGKFTQIRPMKRGGGRRYYRPDDMDLLRGIQHLLYSDGYTIKGVQKILREQGVRAVVAIGRGVMERRGGGAAVEAETRERPVARPSAAPEPAAGRFDSDAADGAGPDVVFEIVETVEIFQSIEIDADDEVEDADFAATEDDEDETPAGQELAEGLVDADEDETVPAETVDDERRAELQTIHDALLELRATYDADLSEIRARYRG